MTSRKLFNILATLLILSASVAACGDEPTTVSVNTVITAAPTAAPQPSPTPIVVIGTAKPTFAGGGLAATPTPPPAGTNSAPQPNYGSGGGNGSGNNPPPLNLTPVVPVSTISVSVNPLPTTEPPAPTVVELANPAILTKMANDNGSANSNSSSSSAGVASSPTAALNGAYPGGSVLNLGGNNGSLIAQRFAPGSSFVTAYTTADSPTAVMSFYTAQTHPAGTSTGPTPNAAQPSGQLASFICGNINNSIGSGAPVVSATVAATSTPVNTPGRGGVPARTATPTIRFTPDPIITGSTRPLTGTITAGTLVTVTVGTPTVNQIPATPAATRTARISSSLNNQKFSACAVKSITPFNNLMSGQFPATGRTLKNFQAQVLAYGPLDSNTIMIFSSMMPGINSLAPGSTLVIITTLP